MYPSPEQISMIKKLLNKLVSKSKTVKYSKKTHPINLNQSLKQISFVRQLLNQLYNIKIRILKLKRINIFLNAKIY